MDGFLEEVELLTSSMNCAIQAEHFNIPPRSRYARNNFYLSRCPFVSDKTESVRPFADARGRAWAPQKGV
jgi:hypothetical protein